MLGNLITPSPEALKAQKEQKTADREARSNELERLRGLLDDFTNEKKIAGLLPEDVESMKKFLKSRISAIQSNPTMTEDQLLALKGNKESQNYDNLYESVKRRAVFHNEFNGFKTEYTTQTEVLKKAGRPIPPEFATGIKLSEEALAWLKKSSFETPDVYDDKTKELQEQFAAKHEGATLGNLEENVEKAKEDAAKKRDNFSFSGLLQDVLKYVGGYFGLFLIFTAMLLGSSLAVNLNLYKNWAFRLLYAFYGAIFCLLVIPYVLVYRWGFLGKKPKFYSILPLFPYHWDSRVAQILLGWISYRPDADIESLKEWQ